MELYALKINGLERPLGFDTELLLCSWKVRGAVGKKQKRAKIEVFGDEALTTCLWQSTGEALRSTGEPLTFALEPRTRYYVRVTAESDANESAQVVTWFETAKLDEPWQGKWLGTGLEQTVHPEFCKAFALREDVKSARLYISGLGLFEAYVNGKKAGDDLLAPFINDYQECVQYCTYDVTEALSAKNELRVFLGNGWYRGRFGLSGQTHKERSFAMIVELWVTYDDGSTEVIGSDESWQVRPSHFTFSDIYDGETQDYTRSVQPWQSVVLTEAPGKLAARYSPTVCAAERLAVKEVIHTPAGETVLDFGQNFAGYVECTQLIPAGQTMTLEFGEILQNGSFYHDNYRTAKSVFTYVSDGEQRTIRPSFTFFGFRYVKVSGLEAADAACFTGCAVYSRMEQTGFLKTGNAKINRLVENALWGLKSNFLDMPTDCPQRDERLGWCGDAQVFSPTAGYFMDTRAFYGKFLRDLRSDQKRNGGRVAIYLPNEFPGLYAAVWSDIGAFLPKMVYDYYDSRELLEANYPLMRDWVDFIHAEDQKRGRRDLYDFGFQFGDWLALDGATEQSTFGRTDNGYVASMYYYASTKYVAEAAKTLELPEAEDYAKRAEAIRSAILREYFTSTGRLAINTQTGYLVALKFGVYLDKQRILDGLKARMKQDCGRLKGGFVGATMMNTVLAENGMTNQAYDLLFYEGFPGWLYAVDLGATTIWERWNSVLPDGSISGTGMNSLNHYSYGSVVEFLFRHSAGILPLEPGFRRVRLEPKPDARLKTMDCRFDSANGEYISRWRILADGSLCFHVEVPFGCEAELCLPEQDMQVLTAGAYDFTIHTQRDYRALYSATTPMERLLADPRAMAVLQNYLPGTAQTLNRSDAEDMSKSLLDVRARLALFRQPTENVDRAIEAIGGLLADLDVGEILHE